VQSEKNNARAQPGTAAGRIVVVFFSPFLYLFSKGGVAFFGGKNVDIFWDIFFWKSKEENF